MGRPSRDIEIKDKWTEGEKRGGVGSWAARAMSLGARGVSKGEEVVLT